MTQREGERASKRTAGTTVISTMLLVTLTTIGQASFSAPDASREIRANAMEREERFIGDRARNRVQINNQSCLLYTSPSPRDTEVSRMPSSA